ncbi:MAG: hypothetical protein sL5_06870 [Candidatus Mesenet longicola]|uniref:Ankyrin repeat domain-containing protein n=1 Tax=Candidatus Mesenet longicola TaxID=1892558 RepID=A0A8J3HPH5_9RICK|nr:MAG: hypothetical protein sGL2_07240 [Candidatus Mesenet longicola]GHM59694.1 MAG: hypothetical protein sL5_06870 [Candidatus Mesenet longicola]
MNSDQDDKRKYWSALDKGLFAYTNREVSLGLKKNDISGIEARVSKCASDMNSSPQEVYGNLLCAAAGRGDVKTAEFCMEKGADPNHLYSDKGSGSITPLGYAKNCESSNSETVNFLKSHGATNDTYRSRWDEVSSSLDKCSHSNQEKQDKGKKDKGECKSM